MKNKIKSVSMCHPDSLLESQVSFRVLQQWSAHHRDQHASSDRERARPEHGSQHRLIHGRWGTMCACDVRGTLDMFSGAALPGPTAGTWNGVSMLK